MYLKSAYILDKVFKNIIFEVYQKSFVCNRGTTFVAHRAPIKGARPIPYTLWSLVSLGELKPNTTIPKGIAIWSIYNGQRHGEPLGWNPPALGFPIQGDLPRVIADATSCTDGSCSSHCP